MNKFQEEDKAKTQAEPQAEPTYEELLAEADASMNVDIEAARQAEAEEEKLAAIRKETLKSIEQHKSIVLSQEAAKISKVILHSRLEEAARMTGRDADAVRLLTDPVRAELKKLMDPEEKLFGKPYANEQMRQFVESMERAVRAASNHGVAEELQNRLENATDPQELSRLHALLESVEGTGVASDREAAAAEVQRVDDEARAWAYQMSQSGAKVRYRAGDGRYVEATIEGFDLQTGRVKLRIPSETDPNETFEDTINPVFLKGMQE